jgi:hypothetical protein
MSNKSLEEIVIGKWSEQWNVTPRVNPDYDRVRRISEKHVVKLPLAYSDNNVCDWVEATEKIRLIYLQKLHREFQMQKRVFNLSLSVPKPEGIYEVTIRNSKSCSGVIIPGLIMEYISGSTLRQLERRGHYNVLAKADSQTRIEIERAQRLGFFSLDANIDSNIIWNPKKRIIYLIDFQDWELEE